MHCCRDGLMTRRWWKLQGSWEWSWNVPSLCEFGCFVYFVSSLVTKRGKTPSFLSILREHGAFASSYVLMWLLWGVKFSLSNFLSWWLGIRHSLLCNVVFMSWSECWMTERSKPTIFCQIVHWVLCVYVVRVVVDGFCDKETHGYDLLMLKTARLKNFDSWKPT
jgi:hypothetical protein